MLLLNSAMPTTVCQGSDSKLQHKTFLPFCVNFELENEFQGSLEKKLQKVMSVLKHFCQLGISFIINGGHVKD